MNNKDDQVLSTHYTQHPVCQEKRLHPDAVAIFSLFNSALTMKQVDRHLSTPSKHGHIFIYGYIVTVLLINYNIAASQLKNREVNSLFDAVMSDTKVQILSCNKRRKQNNIVVTSNIYKILRKYFVVYRSY